MPHFEWTVSLGSVVATIVTVITFIGGAWKFVFNHLAHLEERMRVTVNDNHAALIATVQTVRDDLRDHEHREMHMLDMRFDKVDADMREVRDRVFALTKRD